MSQSVSPVVAPLRPTTAPMSPARISSNLLPLVGVHAQQAPDALTACPWWINTAVPAFSDSAVVADEGELTDERVGHDLERESGEGASLARRAGLAPCRPGSSRSPEGCRSGLASSRPLASNIMADPFVGQLTFVPNYSGTLKAGTAVLNSTKGKRERIGRLLRMHANKREEIDEILAGDIGAVVASRAPPPGHALRHGAPDHPGEDGFPHAGHALAVEPKSTATRRR